MIIILIRTVIIYLVVLTALRIMGKSELSKVSAFQLVVIFMIAELAAIPIESPSASLLNGIIAIFMLVFLQVLISLITLKSDKAKRFFNGRPSTIIEKGEINEKELKSLRISLNELMEQLRLSNYPSVTDVDYAIMEANGQLSVIPKTDKKNITPSDLDIKCSKTYIPLILINGGIIYRQNLFTAGCSEEHLIKEMKNCSISSVKEVFLAFTDEKRKIHFYVSKKGKASEVQKCVHSS